MRKIALRKDDQGFTRMALNDRFIFEIGTLDQGFWPDGIYTAPTDAALVLRREGDAIQPYLHLATGNYNVVTAHLYTDIGLFTCNPEIAADTIDLFNFLTGYSAKRDYQKLFVAPVNLRERMEALIQREIQQHAKDGKGPLVFKMNALVDPKVIRCLYRAAQAGIRVDLGSEESRVRKMCR